MAEFYTYRNNEVFNPDHVVSMKRHVNGSIELFLSNGKAIQVGEGDKYFSVVKRFYDTNTNS